jgi:hypothetical protein
MLTPAAHIRETLSTADFLSTRAGLVSTDDLRRYIPQSNEPVTLAKEQEQ